MPTPDSRPRVLIVDANPDNIHSLLRALSDSNEILVATNSKRALHLASTQQPDAILLDVSLPDCRGYALCQQLKQDPRTSHIPVILLAPEDEAPQLVLGLASGGADYLHSPFSAELVQRRVATQIELQQLRNIKRLQQERQVDQSIRAELDTARQLHTSLIPPALCHDARLEKWELAAHLRTAHALGGDLYDYFFIGEGKLLFALGDASDDGVAAALFMVQVRTLLRAWGETIHCPAQLLETVNRFLCETNSTGMFATLLCGVLDLRTGQVSLASAGHPAPLLVTPEGSVRLEQFAAGKALGLFEDQRFRRHDFTLQPQQSLALYTDGLTAAFAEPGAFQGGSSLLDLVAAGRPASAQQLTELLLREHDCPAQGPRQAATDVALLVLQRPPLAITQWAIRNVGEMADVHSLLSACLEGWNCPPTAIHDCQLVAEELVANALRHAQPTDVRLHWRSLEDFIELSVVDDGWPFDPTGLQSDDHGVGLTLVHNLADHLSYSRVDDSNHTRLRLRKVVVSPNAPAQGATAA